uniref:Coiled-coil domain-containing protein 51 n=1 Tax=Clastoptera arizonana TaxID=38151 RepID=A0A1B6CMH4_9HEMI
MIKTKFAEIINNISNWYRSNTHSSIYLNMANKLRTNLHHVKYQTTSLILEKTSQNNPQKNIILKSKIDEIISWYEKISGMDEVRLAQKRVIDAQDRLIIAQERRRETSKKLAAINNHLKEVYSDIDKTSRGEERYLQLITKEHSLLKEEKQILEEYNLTEQEERNSFTVLSSTVKDSHEKERAQAERTKYWSLIGSVIGTVIGLVGSSINNEFKMRELRKMVKEIVSNGPNFQMYDSETAAVLNKINAELSTIKNNKNPLFKSEKKMFSSDLEMVLERQRKENRNVIISAAIIGTIIPLIIVTLVSRS